MEFTCSRCAGQVVYGQCQKCTALYMAHCPYCGNTLEFEQIELEKEHLLRCSVCHNVKNLQMQMITS